MSLNLDTLGKSEKGNYTLSGMAMCMATHPTMPNRSGHARGRKLHLTKDGKKSLCNMLVDGYFKQDNWISRDQCKICFKEFIS